MQANFAKVLKTPHARLPDELLDAFNHDPAAVVGNTRRLKGWRAVEDIHRRIHRQRDTLQRFIVAAGDGMGVRPPKGGMFGEGMSRLKEALEYLGRERERMAGRSREAGKELAFVKALQGDVKVKYNETLAHVSTVYPEVRSLHPISNTSNT